MGIVLIKDIQELIDDFDIEKCSDCGCEKVEIFQWLPTKYAVEIKDGEVKEAEIVEDWDSYNIDPTNYYHKIKCKNCGKVLFEETM